MSGELPSEVVRNKERIAALERDVGEMKDAIKEIRDKLLGRLPNWATLLLSVLSMAAAGLVVAMVKK